MLVRKWGFRLAYMHNTVKGRKTGNFTDEDGYNESPRRRDSGVSKNPIFVLLSLSFPLVGNPSERFRSSRNDRIR
jgi:hypothetical protein